MPSLSSSSSSSKVVISQSHSTLLTVITEPPNFCESWIPFLDIVCSRADLPIEDLSHIRTSAEPRSIFAFPRSLPRSTNFKSFDVSCIFKSPPPPPPIPLPMHLRNEHAFFNLEVVDDKNVAFGNFEFQKNMNRKQFFNILRRHCCISGPYEIAAFVSTDGSDYDPVNYDASKNIEALSKYQRISVEPSRNKIQVSIYWRDVCFNESIEIRNDQHDDVASLIWNRLLGENANPQDQNHSNSKINSKSLIPAPDQPTSPALIRSKGLLLNSIGARIHRFGDILCDGIVVVNLAGVKPDHLALLSEHLSELSSHSTQSVANKTLGSNGSSIHSSPVCQSSKRVVDDVHKSSISSSSSSSPASSLQGQLSPSIDFNIAYPGRNSGNNNGNYFSAPANDDSYHIHSKSISSCFGNASYIDSSQKHKNTGEDSPGTPIPSAPEIASPRVFNENASLLGPPPPLAKKISTDEGSQQNAAVLNRLCHAYPSCSRGNIETMVGYGLSEYQIDRACNYGKMNSSKNNLESLINYGFGCPLSAPKSGPVSQGDPDWDPNANQSNNQSKHIQFSNKGTQLHHQHQFLSTDQNVNVAKYHQNSSQGGSNYSSSRGNSSAQQQVAGLAARVARRTGYLQKRSKIFGQLRRMFFVLYDNRLEYHKSEDNYLANEKSDKILDIHPNSKLTPGKEACSFVIDTDVRIANQNDGSVFSSLRSNGDDNVWTLVAPSNNDMGLWIESIQVHCRLRRENDDCNHYYNANNALSGSVNGVVSVDGHAHGNGHGNMSFHMGTTQMYASKHDCSSGVNSSIAVPAVIVGPTAGGHSRDSGGNHSNVQNASKNNEIVARLTSLYPSQRIDEIETMVGYGLSEYQIDRACNFGKMNSSKNNLESLINYGFGCPEINPNKPAQLQPMQGGASAQGQGRKCSKCAKDKDSDLLDTDSSHNLCTDCFKLSITMAYNRKSAPLCGACNTPFAGLKVIEHLDKMLVEGKISQQDYDKWQPYFFKIDIPDEFMPPVEILCPFCQESTPAAKTYSYNCKKNHRICFDCVLGSFRICMQKDANNNPVIPFCQSCTPEGGYHLEEQETMTIIELCSQKENFSDVVPPLTKDEKETAKRTMKSLYLKKMHRDLQHVMCPCCFRRKQKDNEKVGGKIQAALGGILAATSRCLVDDTDDNVCWLDLSGVDPHRLCTCIVKECGGQFCGNCQSSPYHFGITCDDYPNYTRAWNDWNQRGKREFMNHLAATDANYRRQLEEFDSNRRQRDADLATFQQRMRDLQDDENFKAANCKRCPSCGRVVQKLSGCDSMKCGSNYHGGDNQNGCGASFNWSTAPGYVANVGDHLTFNENANRAVQPEQAKQYQHKLDFAGEIVDHPCDECNKPIVGPLIMCINCPSYTICLECSNDPRKWKSREHKEDHICTVRMGAQAALAQAARAAGGGHP